MKLRELADRLRCRLEGDGGLDILRVAGLDEAGPGDVTFLANPKYQPAARTTRASALILADDAEAAPCAMLRSPDPYRSFADALALLAPADPAPPGIHPTAVVAADAHLGRDVSIGPLVVVGAGTNLCHACAYLFDRDDFHGVSDAAYPAGIHGTPDNIATPWLEPKESPGCHEYAPMLHVYPTCP